MDNFMTNQFLITIPAGKRLMAKAVISLEQVNNALKNHTIVVVAGTTNGYIAEELLNLIGQTGDFSKGSFFRGVTTAPGRKIEIGQSGYSNKDVVIEKGIWAKDKTIFDAAPNLEKGDIVIKGANAVDPQRTFAGILIGNPAFGTSGPILQAALGKRAELIIPVGLEKRVFDIGKAASLQNAPSAAGLRLLPVTGTIITELEALALLTGVQAELFAAGGILGAEGSCWISVTGTPEQLRSASDLMKTIEREPACY